MRRENIGVSNYCNGYWPPVDLAKELPLIIKELMIENYMDIPYKLKNKLNGRSYGEAIINILEILYSLFFNYNDTPKNFIKPADIPNIFKVKIALEEEMLNKIIKPDMTNDGSIYQSTDACCQYLENLTKNNTGVSHSFFDYVENDMTKEHW